MKVCIHQLGTNKFSTVIDVPNNCTAKEAMQNYLPSRYKKLLSEDFTLGIWGTNLDGKFLPMPESYRLNENDRIEIYYPLVVDPKDARRAKAKKD
mgnify:FL=1